VVRISNFSTQRNFNYYFEKAGKKTADKIVGQLLNRVDILYLNPLSGTKEELLLSHKEDFRYLVESNYKIVYWFENQVIAIATVFDCSRNPTEFNIV